MKYKFLTILIFLFIINILFCNINIVKAAGISDVITGGDNFLQAGNGLGNDALGINETQLQETSKTAFNVLLLIGMGIAIAGAAILGIKFMIGSAEEKAQVKDALVPFVIGCIVIFGAFGIWSIFVNILNKI